MFNRGSGRKPKFSIWYALAALLAFALIQQLVFAPLALRGIEIPYSEFKAALRAGEVMSVSVGQDSIHGTTADEQVFTTVRIEDPELIQELEAQQVESRGETASDGGLFARILGWVLPLALIAGFYTWMMRRTRGGSGVGGGCSHSARARPR